MIRVLLPLFLATALFAQQTQQPAPGSAAKPAVKTASIEGKVISAKTEEPLKKVTVVLIRQSGGGGMSRVETDAAGAFLFKDVQPGKYALMGERTGYARQMYGSRCGNMFAGTPITVSEAQEIKSLVFKLQPSALIAGRVVDSDGDPVGNTIIGALKAGYRDGKRDYLPVGVAQTDDSGEYRIGNLGEGRYYLSAVYQGPVMALVANEQSSLENKATEGYAPTYYPAALDLSAAMPVDLGPGQELRGIEITLVKTPVVRVSGRVPVEAPTILFLTPKGAGLGGIMNRNRAVVQPPEGKFEFANVRPGTYVMTALSASMQAVAGAAVVEVADKNVSGVQLSAAATGDITGVVAYDGQPDLSTKGLQVSIVGADMVALIPSQTSVGEDGKFALKNLPPDRYTVAVTGAADNSYVKSIHYGGHDAAEGFEYTGGGGALEIVVSTRAAQVDGTVTDANNKPFSGATVALIPAGGQFSRYRSSNTGEDGRFSLKGVAPGEYKVLAWEEIEMNQFQDADFVKKFSSKAESVTVDTGGSRTVALKVIPSATQCAAK